VTLKEDTDRFVIGLASKMMGLPKLDVPRIFVYFYTL
jgi:hypothetical protein